MRTLDDFIRSHQTTDPTHRSSRHAPQRPVPPRQHNPSGPRKLVFNAANGRMERVQDDNSNDPDRIIIDPLVQEGMFLEDSDKASEPRHAGLIAQQEIKEATVSVFGCGSGGSFITWLLSLAGIRRFILVDYDNLEQSNLVRHWCGTRHLGKPKIEAVADELRDRAPFMQIESHSIDLTAHPELVRDIVRRSNIAIGATDTPMSRLHVNEAALSERTTALFGRVITRGAGGDVLRVRPGCGPCLACVMGTVAVPNEEITSERQAMAILPEYVSSEERNAMIHPGLATDIMPICLLMVKLALFELQKDCCPTWQLLAQDFEADFYVWANRRDACFASLKPMGLHYSSPSVLRWYPACVERDSACSVCGRVQPHRNDGVPC